MQFACLSAAALSALSPFSPTSAQFAYALCPVDANCNAWDEGAPRQMTDVAGDGSRFRQQVRLAQPAVCPQIIRQLTEHLGYLAELSAGEFGPGAYA
jgi:hypothetical protein